MNPNAIESTLARLRAMAGPEGVSTHPLYGWFGFLDVLQPQSAIEVLQNDDNCLTPSTVLSDQSPPPKSPLGTSRPSRALYRHPNYHLSLSGESSVRCSASHSPESVARSDLTRMRRRIKTLQRRYGKQEMRRWVKTALRALA